MEARDQLVQQGIHTNYLRIRGFPFGTEVLDFLHDHDTVFVVEQNRDGQMKSLLKLETNNPADKLVSILHFNGMPITSDCVVNGVSKHLASEAAA
jgi:2-oxoglutarate ferredoxin oxidoreductase subunit alpha